MHAAPKAANVWPFDPRQTPTLPISAVDMQPLKRIKAWAQFQQLMKNPPVARSKHFVVHRATNPAPAPEDVIKPDPSHVNGLCLAALLPKRWAKRAVTRNALRRQIYAAFANQQTQLVPVPHLVRMRAAMDPTLFTSACSDPLKKAVRQEIDQLLTHLSAA
jgi:ribonuclease P protein component